LVTDELFRKDVVANSERPQVSHYEWQARILQASENTYILCPDEAAKQRMPSVYAAMVIMSTDLAEKQPLLFIHDLKPKKQYSENHFLVYAARRIVSFSMQGVPALI
jgi:hypothetical protein